MSTRSQRRPRGPDPFEVLGVSPMASRQEITAAFRALAKKYHPDRYQGRSERVQRAAEQRMMELNDAYKAVKDGYRRMDEEENLSGGWGASGGVWPGTAPGTWARTGNKSYLRASREQAERAAREHEAQARSFHRLRREAEKSARYGEAIGRLKTSRVPSTLYGIGRAAHSNEVPCRDCNTIQRLPSNWQERLSDTAYFCSNCDRVLLSR